MTIGLGLAARLFLVLLLVVVPAFARIDPADLPVPGISDGSDSGVCDDVTRERPLPLGTPITPQIEVRPVLVSAPNRLLGRGSHLTPPVGRLRPAARPPASRAVRRNRVSQHTPTEGLRPAALEARRYRRFIDAGPRVRTEDRP